MASLIERISRYTVPVALPAGRRDTTTTTANALTATVAQMLVDPASGCTPRLDPLRQRHEDPRRTGSHPEHRLRRQPGQLPAPPTGATPLPTVAWDQRPPDALIKSA